MLASELRAAESRLKKEQALRTEKERQRVEKERLVAERQRRREQEREEENARKRLEEQEREIAEQAAREQLATNNRGVFWQAVLQPSLLDEAAVAARGIRRFKDKVCLPASASPELMAQDAPKNGPMLFEVRTASGACTHVGVLEFNMPEGAVALPRKVVDCLWGRGQQPQGRVTVTYKFLPKGEFVRFQPLNRGFHEDMADCMREVLEAALQGCSTLTEGDLIQVVASEGLVSGHALSTSGDGSGPAERVYDLRVQELKPSAAVCCMDTDMEAEVVPSLETEQVLKELEEQSRRLRQLAEERELAEQQAAALARESEAEAERKQAQRAEERERIRQGIEASLPAEIPAGDPRPHLTAVFRMPDGTRSTRRFLLDDPSSLLFAFADAMGAGGLDMGSFDLVTQFPRRVLRKAALVGVLEGAEAAAGSGATPHSGPSLQEVGLGQGQEVFYLEASAPSPETMEA